MSFMLKNWAGLYNGTEAEWAIEAAIASLGRPYRWQHPLWALAVFPDFVLHADRVVIEVDDDGHHTAEGIEKDKARTAKLKLAGWRVVRCTNEEAIRDPYGTVNRLMTELGLPYVAKETLGPSLERPTARSPRRPSRRRSSK